MTTVSGPLPAPAGARSMLDVLHDRASRLGARPAFFRRRDGRWEPISWRTYEADVSRCARALKRRGVGAGDGVCILSFNRFEWVVADLAAMAVGAVPAGIYTTCSPDQCQYILEHCEAPIVFVEDAAQLRKIAEVKDRLPKLRAAVLLEPGGEGTDLPWVVSWDALLAEGDAVPEAEYGAMLAAIEPTALATLIYTSGTTGPPKGVMLSHRNLLWTVEKLTATLGTPGAERLLSYLPLSHIAEQQNTIHAALWNGMEVYFAESMEKIREHLPEVRPTLFLAVPRVWEKMKAGIEAKVAEAPPRRQALFRRALAVGKAHYLAKMQKVSPGLSVSLQHALFDRLVYSKLKQRLGLDQARAGFTAAAPIGRDVLDFFWSLGLPILEVYGQSEGTGPTTVSSETAYKVGTVGRPMQGVEVKIDVDGEILFRGGNVFMGYYKDARATSETLTPDGWLRSGDVGEFDAEGYLRITDRKKELIVTSGGKKTGPATLEAILKGIPPIAQAVVVGDNRKYLVALLTLEPQLAEQWAAQAGVPFAGLAKLAAEPKLLAHLGREIEEKLNKHVAKFETIKRFKVLPVEFESGEHGELTPTMKLRRKVIAQKWAAEIEALYQGEAEAPAA